MANPLEEKVEKLIASFAGSPGVARQGFADLLARDPTAFRAAAVAALRNLGDPLCRRCLFELMLRGRLLPACDPALMELEEEAALVRELSEMDPSLDMKLAQRLSGESSQAATGETARRVLDLLAAVPENPRILPMVIKVLRSPNPELRSKAALVIGRLSRAPEIARQLLAEPDPRVRANAVEALWGMDSTKARLVLRQAVEDPNNRVVGNALLGLYRLGDVSAISGILRMAGHPEPLFRATAAWIMEKSASPRFLPALGQMVRENDPKTRSRVFQAIARIKRASNAVSLTRLHVQLMAVSLGQDGLRRASAAIASGTGQEIPGLLATDVVLWEGPHIVPDYSLKPAAPLDGLAVGLVLPEGAGGDRTLSAFSELKGEQVRWSAVRYSGDATAAALDQAFAFLSACPADRHLIFVAPGDEPDAAEWAAIVARGRASSIGPHAIPSGYRDPAGLAAACQRIYLNLLHAYEIVWRGGENASAPGELKLEVYAGQGYGVCVLKAPASDLLSAA